MAMSLWGDEFELPERKESPKKTKATVDKVNNPKKPKTVQQTVKSKTVDISTKLTLIENEVHRILGKYEEDTIVITSREELHSYIDKSINNGIIAIDTETNNSLDPITCKIMGGCIYTPSLKNAYIPINHVNRLTGEKLENQLTEQDLKEEFDRLTDTKIIMHSGKFDYQVIKCTCDCDLKCYWDTMIGARILNENELAGLKEQYRTKIDPQQDKYDIEHLFQGLEYAIVDPKLFALYAATDSFITYKLYEYQLKEFTKPENARLFNLFQTVEMPVMKVAADMELTGVSVDLEYADRLGKKFHNRLDAIDTDISNELEKLRDKISAWRLTEDANYHPPKKTGEGVGKSKNEQLEDPISVSSPTQLAILIYDVLKIKSMDKKSPRGTGEEILLKIVEQYPQYKIFDLILKRRGIIKLTTTYIDSIPELAKRWPDNRVRTHFNQLGAGTGRFSSSDPINLQNIPSHENSIRMIFKATDGYTMVGGDFSQQEPRLLANYSKDENMITAYTEGKDLYATIAMGVYHNKYEDNKEFYPDGTMNPDGKKRRSNCKSLLLG